MHMNQNTQSQLKTDVCIVGAGPGGALLSYLLNQKGISTMLIERQPHLHKSFRGELLNVDGEAILNKHGLYSLIQQRGALLLEQIQYWENGQIIHTVSPGNGESHVGIHVPQDHLLEAIVSHAQQHNSNEQVLFNTIMTGLLRDKNGQVVGINISAEGCSCLH